MNNSSARYYQKRKRKESIGKKALEMYQNLSEEKKNENDNMVTNDTNKLSEYEKQRLNEYRKRYFKLWKNAPQRFSGHHKL